jgi:type II secretory pathway component PulF
MPRFSYIARSATGERVQGSIEAPDKRSALVQIERQALFPVSVTEGGAAPAAPAAGEKPKAGKTPVPGLSVFAGKRPGRQPKMGVRDLLLFSRELSDLLQSGMTLGNALNTLSKRKMKAGQDIIVADLRDNIIKGASLSDALAQWPRTFGNLYVSMVRAGEVSGQVHEALLRLCVHYERVQEAREKVIGALTYPAIVLGAGFVTMIFTMLFVIPKFAAVFADLGSTLPLPTRILLGTSRFLLEWGWALVIVILLAIGAFRRWLKTEKGRFRWDGFELRMPIFKQIVSANAFAQFARTLGALLQNGVPVLQALSIVENTVGNAVIAGEIREARTRVTDGSTISGPLSAGKVFPPLLTDMLAVGEETGDMPAALANIARRYDTDLDRAVKVLTTVLEPILILLVAVLVGFVAISMLMAVFELTSGLKM